MWATNLNDWNNNLLGKYLNRNHFIFYQGCIKNFINILGIKISTSKSFSYLSITVYIYYIANPVYIVWSIETFRHIVNSKVAKFHEWMLFVGSTLYGDGNQYIYWDTISRWFLIKAKDWFACSGLNIDSLYTSNIYQLVQRKIWYKK